MRINRHKFIMLYFSRRRNMALETNNAKYLRPVFKDGPTHSRSYHCGKNSMKNIEFNGAMKMQVMRKAVLKVMQKKAMKKMKTMKNMKVMKGMKVMKNMKIKTWE